MFGLSDGGIKKNENITALWLHMRREMTFSYKTENLYLEKK